MGPKSAKIGPYFGLFGAPIWPVLGIYSWPSSGNGQKGDFGVPKRPKRAIFGSLFGSILGPLFGPLLARFRLGLPTISAWRRVPFWTQIWPKYGSKTNQNGPLNQDVIFPYRRGPLGPTPKSTETGFLGHFMRNFFYGTCQEGPTRIRRPRFNPGRGLEVPKRALFWVIFGPILGHIWDPYLEVLATEP